MRRSGALAAGVARAALSLRRYQVSGKPHFHDRKSAAVLEQSTLPGGEHRATVEVAIQAILDRELQPPTVTTVQV